MVFLWLGAEWDAMANPWGRDFAGKFRGRRIFHREGAKGEDREMNIQHPTPNDRTRNTHAFFIGC